MNKVQHVFDKIPERNSGKCIIHFLTPKIQNHLHKNLNIDRKYIKKKVINFKINLISCTLPKPSKEEKYKNAKSF